MATLAERTSRKSEILAAAEELMGSRGVESVSMEEIAHKVGISKGAVYLHFTNRADLVVTLSERYGAMLNSRFVKVFSQPLDGLGILKKFGEIFIQFAHRHPLYFPTLQQFQKSSRDPSSQTLDSVTRCQQQVEEAISYVTRAAQIGMQDGSITTRLDPRTLGLLIYSAARGVIEVSGRLASSGSAGFMGFSENTPRSHADAQMNGAAGPVTGELMKSFMDLLEHGLTPG